MPLTGTLRSWNEDRGFGFIAPSHGGPEVFVHVSAFPRDGTHPTVGEKLTYELGRGRDGKPQASRVVRLAVGSPPAPRRPSNASRPSGTNWLGVVVMVAILGVIGAYGYSQFTEASQRHELAQQPSGPVAPTAVQPLSVLYRCDGRTHCSQMTSCAEATWFIKNCPGTAMDGNNDGIPCEQQWCTSPFAK